MSTPERLPRIPDQDDDSSTQKEANLSTAHHRNARRVERRFEIGFFIRRKVGRALAFYRQYALTRGRAQAAAGQRNLAAPSPPPPSEEGEATDSPVAMKAFAVRAAQGTSTGDTSGDPVFMPMAVMPEDDGGPIHGASYEIGAFASATTETTTDDDA